MKLTVIIVNYNVKYFVEQCVESLRRALDGIDSEIVVVDNHSKDGSVEDSNSAPDAEALADVFKTTILDDMRDLRIVVDTMETVSPADVWPYPSYGEILFGVR